MKFCTNVYPLALSARTVVHSMVHATLVSTSLAHTAPLLKHSTDLQNTLSTLNGNFLPISHIKEMHSGASLFCIKKDRQSKKILLNKIHYHFNLIFSINCTKITDLSKQFVDFDGKPISNLCFCCKIEPNNAVEPLKMKGRMYYGIFKIRKKI